MNAKRKRHDPEFKARVALEALKGVKTIQQIAKDFDIHPVQASEWKKKMEEWFERYNNWRPHEKLGNLTPAVVYQAPPATPKAA